MRATIARQLQQLTRLVDDLLDVARINQGRVQIQRQRIDLVAVVRAALDAAQPAYKAKGVELSATLPRASLPLDADATRLTQVLGNLLSNAAKFTDGGGRVELTLERDGAQTGDQAVIRVRDNGLGIAADQLTRIFDMFVQADSSIERSRDGLGLGLTLVRQLVDAHGGTVAAASAGIGHGSEFTVRLPLADAMQIAESAAVQATQTPAPVAQRRILLVDDNDDAAQTLRLVLEMDGHELRTASDGPSALALLQTWQPDVVLLDIGLPGMSGYEVARRIGRQPWRAGVRLIALTGYGQADDRQRSAEVGFDAHLVKPVDLRELARLLALPLPPQAAS